MTKARRRRSPSFFVFEAVFSEGRRRKETMKIGDGNINHALATATTTTTSGAQCRTGGRRRRGTICITILFRILRNFLLRRFMRISPYRAADDVRRRPRAIRLSPPRSLGWPRARETRGARRAEKVCVRECGLERGLPRRAPLTLV